MNIGTLYKQIPLIHSHLSLGQDLILNISKRDINLCSVQQFSKSNLPEEYFIEKKTPNLNLGGEHNDYFAGLGPFCIQSFIKMAKDEFTLEEGNWFRSTTFLMSLEYMLKRNDDLIQDTNLKVYNSIDNVVFLENVFKLLYKPAEEIKLGKLKNIGSGTDDNKGICSNLDNPNDPKLATQIPTQDEQNPKIKDVINTKEKIAEDQDKTNKTNKTNKTEQKEEVIIESKPFHLKILPSDQPYICESPPSELLSNSQHLDFWEFHDQTLSSLLDWVMDRNEEPLRPVLMCINTMLGLNEIDLDLEPFVKKLLSLSSFVGMLGGKEYKAFYFIGFDDNYFYYLDPHYVKKAHEAGYNDENYIKNYFKKKIFKSRFKDISPSLSFCFLLRSNKGDFFIFICI